MLRSDARQKLDSSGSLNSLAAVRRRILSRKVGAPIECSIRILERSFLPGSASKLIRPIPLAIVMPMQPCFVVACDESCFGIFWPLLDGFTGQVDEDFRFFPTDSFNPPRRNQNLFTRPPVSRIDNQVADSPRLVINDKVINVADLSVPGLDCTASYILRAAEVRIVAFRITTTGFGPSTLPTVRVGGAPPHVGATPISRPAVIGVVLHFVLARDWFVGIQGWTVLNLLSGQVHRDYLVILTGRVQSVRRNGNPSAAQPASRITHEILNP